MTGIPTAYHTKLEEYKNNHNDYLEIPLPKEIEEIEDLQPALRELHRIEREDLEQDKMKALFPTLVTPDKDGKEDEPAYIRIDFEPQSRHEYVIKADESSEELSEKGKKNRERTKPKLTEHLCYYMTVPTAFLDGRSDSPLYGFERGDDVTLELNQEDNHMRIYTAEDYRARDEELSEEGRKPVHKKLTATGLSLNFIDQYTDPTGIGDAGQKFRLIPFESHHSVFERRTTQPSNEDELPKFDDFQEVLEREKIPKVKAAKLTIRWSLNQTRDYSNHEWTGKTGDNPRQETIYTNYFVNEAKVVLPCKGEFEITATTQNGTNAAWLTHSPTGSKNHNRLVGDDWYTKYYGDNRIEDAFTVYVPCE